MVTLTSLPSQFQPAHASFIQLDVVLAASSACVSTAIRLNAPLSALPHLLSAAIQGVPRFGAVIMHPQTLNRNELPKATTLLSTTPPSSPDSASPRASVDASTRTSSQFPWHQNNQSSGDSDRKSSNVDAPLVFDISDREDEFGETAVSVDTNDAAVKTCEPITFFLEDNDCASRCDSANGTLDPVDHIVEDMEATQRDEQHDYSGTMENHLVEKVDTETNVQHDYAGTMENHFAENGESETNQIGLEEAVKLLHELTDGMKKHCHKKRPGTGHKFR